MSNVKRGYMIRRLADGLWSRGGADPGFNKTGRMWMTLGNLREHLRRSSYQEDCEVIPVQIIPEDPLSLEAAAAAFLEPPTHYRKQGQIKALCGPETPARACNRKDSVTCPNCLRMLGLKP